MNRYSLTRSIHGLLPLAILATLLLAACSRGGRGEAGAPAAIEAPVASVSAEEGSTALELTGTVTGRLSIPLSTKLMSEITMLEVEEGQRVSEGQLLVRIDDSDIRAMRSEAAAYRAEARAALSEVEAVRRQAEATVTQASAAISQAEAALEDAERDLSRFQALYERSVVSRAELDKVQLGADLARQNLEQARAARSQAEAAVAQADSRNPQVEAKEQQAGARDLQAQALQDYAVLRAPFDGIVKARYFEPGQLSVPGQPILVIEQAGTLRVQLAIPDHTAMALSPGQRLQIAIDGPGGRELREGTLVVLGASADPASRSVPAELELDNAEGLLSGQFVRVLVPSGTSRILWVPENAVVSDGEEFHVWRVSSGGLLTRAAVEPGRRMEGRVEILRGLSEGERVVSDPPPGLYAGARVAGAGAPAAEGH